jgi:hypothetical protein
MMVKIRYSELPVGLHVSVKVRGRATIIYLLPGLTADQRRAALLRVRSSARMGQGPALPALGVAAAIAVDRVRTTVRNGAAAMRAHPVLLLPPLIVLVSSAIVFVLMSFVSLTVHHPAAPLLPRPSVGASSVPHFRHHIRTTGPSGQGGQGTAPGPGGSTDPAPSGSASAAPTVPPPVVPTPSGSSAPPTLAPTPTPAPTSASPVPVPTTAAPSPSPTCLELGPLGLCVHL